MKTFYFNTGVKPWNSTYMNEGDKWVNNERHIPMHVNDVPENSTFKFASPFILDNADSYIVRKITSLDGGLNGTYGYFI